ncbi:MAG: hypothetical protein CVT62_13170 [Actinobacteria bacterium HGW-Actinobacteria-2]|nr:MAG: hypothetical protein CVT62_13170 [Actinobacteria bacterium HGW-Actinobacteria-2]
MAVNQLRLLAVLLNPPRSTSGARTLGAVQRAAAVLGFGDLTIANLFADRTMDVIELNHLDSHSPWPANQSQIATQLSLADGVLAGWGVAGASGAFRCERARRAQWLYTAAAAAGHETIWMVGGEPRHPSRWHQFVADAHGRTPGGSFEERLAHVLVAVPTPAPAAGRTPLPAAVSPRAQLGEKRPTRPVARSL